MGRFKEELAGFAILLLAAYVLIALYGGDTGAVGRAVAGWLEGLLGVTAGLAAVLVALIGLDLLLGRSIRRTLARAVAAALFEGAAATVAQVLAAPRFSQAAGLAAPAGEGGGRVGAYLSGMMERSVGRAGTYLAVAAAAVMAAALAFGVGPLGLLSWPTGAARRAAAAAWLAVRWALRAASGAARAVRAIPRRTGSASDTPSGRARARPSEPPPLAPEEPAAIPPGSRNTASAGAGPGRRPEAAEGGPTLSGPAGSTLGLPGGEASDRPSDKRPWLAGPTSPGARRSADTAVSPATPPRGAWRLPPVALLSRQPPRRRVADDLETQERSRLLERTLASFGIEARVVSHTRGPVVTRYEMALAPGIKLSRVVSLADDLALALASTGVRIEAPVPGKPVVGVEVPNGHVEPVTLREVLESPAFSRSPAPLALALGRDVAGEPVVADLERLIHLLIAGATGSGKSVCLASIIMSLLFRLTPDQLRLLLIDPKRVELTVYDGIPHLLAPVVTEVKQAALALRWAVAEMESRYQELARRGARHLAAYNQLAAQGHVEAPLPYVVVVIDELADLMMVAPAEVEDSICRLAQMARAAGIHLVIATQRPSTDVITGLIKANIPSRLAFAVSSQVDSRTILDTGGAERLLGRGDMLYHPLGEPKPIRAQGCLVTERDVEQVVRFWKDQGPADYRVNVFEEASHESEAQSQEDDLFDEAVQLVSEVGQASVSLLQRRFRIGYARAARLIDLMEQRGIVGPYQGSRPRDVLPPHRHRSHPA